jgi:hypothetical protein
MEIVTHYQECCQVKKLRLFVVISLEKSCLIDS